MIGNNSLGSLTGKSVVGPDGESIGKVADVYESTDGGGGTFATVNTGLFGGGTSFFPLDQAELSGDDVSVPYTKSFIKDAPRVENDEELTAPEEQRLFEYYSAGGLGETGTQPVPRGTAREDVDGDGVYDDVQDTAVGRDTSGLTTDDAMTRSEERLEVGTATQEVGRARLRKRVITETETRTVPVSHEEVRVEREPITGANRGPALDGPAISEEGHEVVLNAEKPVVAKEAVPVERVRLDKETVTDQVEVTEDVRKEQIEVDGADDVYPAGSDETRSRTEKDVEPRT
ncbi:MAG: PRC and DUF2382 domain-containing protein [Frankiaceae bacterium]|nr:PRC and DUF2382 domain-containing protein [Frankiaceae bacterium]